MKIDLREENIDTNLFENSQQTADVYHDSYHIILAHLSTYFNNSIIVDVGTHWGHGAAALSHNKTNKVYTYDVVYIDQALQKFQNDEYENIEYIIRDCIKDNWQSKIDEEIFLSSELICLDVDPHDGIQEQVVLRFLVENNWKGIMFCDDIIGGTSYKENEPYSESAIQMQKFWNNIELLKYDITDNKYAHETGTGIVCFDNQEVII